MEEWKSIEDYDNYESEKKEEDNSETNNFSKSYLNLLENNTQSKSVKRTLFFHSNEKGKKIKEGKKCRTMIDMNNSKDYLNNSFEIDFSSLMMLINSRQIYTNPEISSDYQRLMQEFNQAAY